jgi:hypothetical protein
MAHILGGVTSGEFGHGHDLQADGLQPGEDLPGCALVGNNQAGELPALGGEAGQGEQHEVALLR